MIKRCRKALSDFYQGVRSGYPLCCVLHFVFDTLRSDYSGQLGRYVRNVQYTPCWLHMRIANQSKEKALKELIEDCCIDLGSVYYENPKNKNEWLFLYFVGKSREN